MCLIRRHQISSCRRPPCEDVLCSEFESPNGQLLQTNFQMSNEHIYLLFFSLDANIDRRNDTYRASLWGCRNAPLTYNIWDRCDRRTEFQRDVVNIAL